MREVPIRTPPSTGVAPPERPVPAPRATTGTRASSSRRMQSAVSRVVRGSATSSGSARTKARPSHS